MQTHDPAGYQPTQVSQAVRADGPFVFVSGQVPRPPHGGAAAAAPEDQFRQIWTNLIAVLDAAGATVEQLVQLRAFLSDRRHWDAFRAVRQEFLGSHRPAITAVVCELADPTWVAELEAVASLA
jgi:2-iminobutanoate/2-iminopropanoate deaminase